jgi:AraC-like DNA-binding protein
VIGDIGNGVRLFPDINRPGYVPAGRLSGFGWPNLLAYWNTVELSFHQPVVPFTIVLPVKGSVRISVDGWQLEVPNETYVAVPAGSELRIKELVVEREGERAELLIAFCNPTFVRNVWQSEDDRFHPIVRLYRSDGVSARLGEGLAEYLEAPAEAITDDEVEDLLYGIIRTFAARDKEDRTRWAELSARDDDERVRLFAQLSRARDLANAAFRRPLTVDELAAEAGLSKYHFIRLFDRAFSATPYRYLHELRLAHARKRLEGGFRDIGALCDECGFQSLGSFSWAFKRRYGSYPRNFAISEKSE